MVTVKPETDEQHLRLRAYWCAWARRAAGKPLRRQDIDRLVIKGGKDSRVDHTIEPTAA